MRILPGNAPDEALIDPISLEGRLLVRGLAPDALRALIRGEAAGRRAWRPGLSVSAELADVLAEPSGEPQAIDLEDGCVHLHSGARGRIEIEAAHATGDTLLPRSLNLLLAQQWARAGIMMVHGAAFSHEAHGILALGRQGAGKSTLTSAVLAAGGRVVSDDWILLGASPSGALRAQRLRHFLMLRQNPSTRKLLSALPDLRLEETQQRRKLVAPIDNQPDSLAQRFTEATDIERIWLLEAPADVRPTVSRQQQIDDGSASLAQFIEATMPLLFSTRFPVERKALLAIVNRLRREVPISRLQAGAEIVTAPGQSLSRLLKQQTKNPA